MKLVRVELFGGLVDGTHVTAEAGVGCIVIPVSVPDAKFFGGHPGLTLEAGVIGTAKYVLTPDGRYVYQPEPGA